MHNHKRPDKERVRVELLKKTLNAASNKAGAKGKTLSAYIQDLIDTDLDKENDQLGKTEKELVSGESPNCNQDSVIDNASGCTALLDAKGLVIIDYKLQARSIRSDSKN